MRARCGSIVVGLMLLLLSPLSVGAQTAAGPVVRVRTDKDVHFTGSLAQSAAAEENLSATYVPLALRSAGGKARGRLLSIRILSDQNLAWEVWLYRDSGFDTTNADTEGFLGRWTFAAGDGILATGDSFYHYYIDGLDVAHESDDGLVHLRLVNRSATSKNAGATGEIVVELGFAPTTQQQ